MNLPLAGGCQCGALRYEVRAEPILTYTCHCVACQHVTSSAFSLAILVSESAFHLTSGEPRQVQRLADSGRMTTRWLCPDCLCWVCSSPTPDPQQGAMVRRVRAGSLDDTSWLRPTAHFWTRSKQPWVTLPEGSRIHETQPA